VSETIKAYRAEPYSYDEAKALALELELSDPVAITLVRRGYRTPEQARAFLEADESHDPGEFNSMAAVTARIRAAIEAGERISVHGDFDVDGVCATTIMVSALRELGAECDWLIPDRIADGYGLSRANVEVLAERGTKLIVTVDCGITAVDEVAHAKSLDLDVVVTDHHQAAAELPDCLILHPSIDGYPFTDLCGTAVAWKLACALRADPAGQSDLDLVALATVADVVPLIGENRSLVKRGLEEARRGRRLGLRALIAASGCEPTRLDEGDFAFRLGPRINAAGRLYRADAGVELFLSEDESRAAAIAEELGRANGERRATEREVDSAAEAARRELPEALLEAPAIVVAGEGWHPGVVGIVASRMVERHNRPTIVISLDGEGGGRGSGRSIPGFDLLAALEACSEHLVGFGGHRAAAGLELREDAVDAFREAFAAHAASVIGAEDLVRTERIDAMVGGADLGLDLAEELGRLAPFGMGNPGVRLLVPAANVRDVRPMGEGNKHSRFSLHSGEHRALGVAFGRPSLGVGEADTVDAAVRLELNHWNGAVEPRVVLRELYPHPGDAPAEQDADAEWWQRFEEELVAELPGGGATMTIPEGRTRVRSTGAVAAILSELASCGEPVLAVVADLPRRALLAETGARVLAYSELERDPEIAGGYEHVVLVDPPPSARHDAIAALPAAGGGYLHVSWGEREHSFAIDALGTQLARRDELINLFRELRDSGECDGEKLLAALRGSGPYPRSPEAAARCFRVLAELGLVHGDPNRGAGLVGVVSSEGTDLERSEAFQAYGARHQESLRYLQGLKQS
jgi:single-stranded-DNA-specific exonuclease